MAETKQANDMPAVGQRPAVNYDDIEGYGIERRLAQISPALHGRYRDCIAVSWRMLNRYTHYFPNYTDHTVLHTMDILDLCNQLIGDQLEALSAEDLYVLLMGVRCSTMWAWASPKRTLTCSGRRWASRSRAGTRR